MRNYRTIKRLYEETALPTTDSAQLETPVEAPEVPMLPEPAPTPGMSEPMALPAPAMPAQGAMSMTVADFIAKCKEIDPLVCMGIESFIEKNQAAFGATAPAQAATPDITFSNAIAQQMTPPAPAQGFSLDQSPEELKFPA